MKDNLEYIRRKPKTDDDYLHAAHLMRTGGSFAKHIAEAYMCADRSNKERLKAAFPDLFTRFYDEYFRSTHGLG
jgi:hypothetical protein